MSNVSFPDLPLALLKRSLDAYVLRQKVTAENIANAETAGYRTRSVSFEDLLQDIKLGESELAPSRSADLHKSQAAKSLPVAQMKETSPNAMDNGINDVNLDMEMATLAETNLSHKMAARILAMRYQLLRSAIRGRN
jgi:flagellar basal-body rod protein FlgB